MSTDRTEESKPVLEHEDKYAHNWVETDRDVFGDKDYQCSKCGKIASRHPISFAKDCPGTKGTEVDKCKTEKIKCSSCCETYTKGWNMCPFCSNRTDESKPEPTKSSTFVDDTKNCLAAMSEGGVFHRKIMEKALRIIESQTEQLQQYKRMISIPDLFTDGFLAVGQELINRDVQIKEIEDRRANASFNERKAYEVIRAKEDRIEELNKQLAIIQQLERTVVDLEDQLSDVIKRAAVAESDWQVAEEQLAAKDKEIERLKEILAAVESVYPGRFKIEQALKGE